MRTGTASRKSKSGAKLKSNVETKPPHSSRKKSSPPKAQSSVLDNVQAVVQVCIEQKGLDVRGLDLHGLTDVADYFVIASGTSERHVRGIADKIERALGTLGEKPFAVSGYENGQWVLLDYGDLVAHVFYEPVRQYYEFDGLWKRAPAIPLDEELEVQARKLRTGMFR
jgi:ribosome-associated protein